MPYKKKSPFASYRDPKQAKRNFNPIDFKMPDLNSIYNKTANGSTTTTDLATDNKTGSPEEGKTPGLVPKSSSSKMLEQIKGTEENKEKQQSVAKKRKTQVREDRKKFNKAYRDAREAKNMGSRFQTSEEQSKAQETFNDMKGERKFRTKALLAGKNKEDLRSGVMGPTAPQPPTVKKAKPLSQNMLNQAHNVNIMDKKGKQGSFSHMLDKSKKENIPMDRMKVTNIGLVTSGGAGKAPFKKPTKTKVADLYTQQEQSDDLNEMNNLMDDRKFNAINNPLGRGFNMVSRKGSAFPMVSDSPLNVVTNNRDNAAGTGSVIVNNTGTGTGNSSGGTGGGGGGTGIGSGSGSGGGSGGGSSNNNFDNSVADSGALDTDGSSVSNSGNGGTATTGGGGGGNFNTSNAGTGSQNVGSGGTTVNTIATLDDGSSVNNNSGNTGVTGALGPGGRPSGGSNAATAVADGIKQADRPTNYRPPNPPPIRREDTIGKDGQVFTPNPNRAAKGDKTMTNNVLPGLAAGSVPSRGIQRDIQFNNKAMSSGDLYAPPQPTGMNANTDASLNKTTSTGNSEAMSMFAAFSDPKEIDSNIKEDTENLNDTIDKNMSSITQSISGMPKPGLEGGGSEGKMKGKMKFLKNLIKDESGAAPEMNASRSSFAKAIDFGSLKKGALKQELNVPEDETIPKSKLQIKSGDSKLTQKRKRFAETMSKFKK
tara:strand:- start:453 stop:2576 length:2124 start_codon:yes stop_codon:yes gene_type:complete